MKKLGLFFILFISVFLFKTANVYAVVGGLIQNGDSLKGNVRIGYNNVGTGFYEFSSGTSDSSDFYMNSLGFQPTYLETSQSGTRQYHFTVDFCINGSIPELTLTSYYTNYVDYVYSLGTHVYVSNGDWARTNCFRAFVRLNLTYYLNYGSQGNDVLQLSSNGNWFWVYANYGYNNLLRYEDMIYYTEETYNERLLQAQQFGGSNTIISQNETIINQNSSINNSINNVDSSIKDDNIDTTSSNSFFSNFSTTDNGGISSVITAPLTFINSMTSTCSPLSFTIFNETISLPCGNTLFWDRQDVVAFRNLWNILVGGAVVYMVVRKTFLTIEEMKDPESDKVSVMDL